MVAKIEVTDAADLASVAHTIHDRLFELDEVTVQDETATIPFADQLFDDERTLKRTWLSERVVVPLRRAILRIHEVVSFSIRDRAEVGTYDLSDIEYDPARGVVLVSASPPLEIELTVRGLHVEVESTSELVGTRRITRWPWLLGAESSSIRIDPL